LICGKPWRSVFGAQVAGSGVGTRGLRIVAAGLLLAAVSFVAVGAASVMTAAAPSLGNKDNSFQTSVPDAILIEPTTDSVLFEKNADQPVAPASLAKLMTLEFVFNQIKQGQLKLDDQFTISENAWRKGGAPSHGTTMFAPIHSQVSVRDLIRGIVVDSANDACIAIAEALAGGDPAFGRMLTRRAREIGLTHSIFTNSTGYADPDLHVTVRDMAELARHIIQTYPDLYPYFAERDFTYNKIRQNNRNPLLAMGIGADGLKTGETPDGAFDLVGSALDDQTRLILVIAGAKSDKERAEEARKLLEWGFRTFEMRIVFAKDQTIGSAKIFGGATSYVPLVAPGAIRMMVPRYGDSGLVARVDYTGPVAAPVRKGQRIGQLKIWRGNDLSLEVPVAAATDVGKGTLSQRAMDGVGELFMRLVRAGLNRL
jgi:serine-type D-Ala-D-Ala carboxypeptidase (penicillin-binding protein 5/6)